MTRDTTRRPLPKLRPLDEPAIEAEAAVWVADRLDGITDPEKRAKAAAALVRPCIREADKWRPQRDAAAVSLSIEFFGRKRTGIPQAAGINKARLNFLRDSLPAGAVDQAHMDDAADVLNRTAIKVVRQEARAEAARRARDEAALKLLGPDYGWSNADVARLIGTDPSRVSHIKKKHLGESAA